MTHNLDEDSKTYLSRYATVTAAVEKKICRHINRYDLQGSVVAYYKDWDDFCSDWCKGLRYTKTEARKILHGGIGEFQSILGFGIIRFFM